MADDTPKPLAPPNRELERAWRAHRGGRPIPRRCVHCGRTHDRSSRECIDCERDGAASVWREILRRSGALR